MTFVLEILNILLKTEVVVGFLYVILLDVLDL